MTSHNNNPQNNALIPQEGGKEIDLPNHEPMPAFVAKRLGDLKRHIEADLDLIGEYETLLQEDDDPQRKRKYRRVINERKRALLQYGQEFDQVSQGGIVGVLADDNAPIMRELHALRTQLAQMERRIVGKQNVHEKLLEALKDEQRTVIDELFRLVDQQQLTHEETRTINQLVQDALGQLQQTPDSQYWTELAEAVNAQESLEGKLKLTLPLIPTLVEYELELSSDILPDLQALWAQLRNRIT